MAVNPRILYGYASSDMAATVSPAGTASGYDPANVVALERATGWKASDTTSRRLILHAGAAIQPSGLGICGGNYSVWGTTNLQYSSDGSSWTTQVALSSLPSVDYLQDYFATLTAAPSRAWWALQWTAPSAAPDLAVFYLGTLVTLSDSPDLPYDEGPLYGVNLKMSEGQINNAERVARRRMKFLPTWDVLSAVKDQLLTLTDSEDGPYRPFFWVPMDESGSSTQGRAYLVRYQAGENLIRRLYGHYKLGLPMVEEV